MELQEIGNLWKSLSNDQVVVNRQVIKEITFQKVKAVLHPFKVELLFEMIVDVLFIFFLMDFISDHMGQVQFLIPAGILFMVTIASLVLVVSQILLYYGIHADEPVVKAQEKITKLQYWERVEANSLMIIIPLYSAPIVIVLAKAFLHLNLYLLGDWIFSYTVGSLLVGLIVVYFIRKFPSKKLKEISLFLNDLHEGD